MLVDTGSLMKELAKIKRDRELVKTSLVSEAAKAKLYAQLDARVAAISKELEAADVASQASNGTFKGR